MTSKFKGIMLASFACISLVACSKQATENISSKQTLAQTKKPNIILLYTDDLGLGDVSAYAKGTLHTPNIDKIAKNGILFNKGYATAATCTPSRYSLFTGNYPFRKKGARVLQGDAPLLISTTKDTLPKMLQRAGYITGAIGKWHLGLGNGNVDWNKQITPGANEIGFDYSYLMATTNDRAPSIYLKNGMIDKLDPNDPIYVNYKKNFPGEPSGKNNPELLKMKSARGGHNHSIHNGIGRIGYQTGGKSARFIDEDMGDDFLRESINFIETNQDKAFFLYYGFHQPHVPRVPHPRFVGKSGMGPRGDTILEADWAVGQFMDKLDALGLTGNTLVIFSSDNGHVLNDGYLDDAVEKLGDHTPWANMRGGKYSLLEAGAHVPFIVQWKGTVVPSVSDAFVSQHDFLASLASLTGQDYSSIDSENHLAALLGQDPIGRKTMIVEGTQNSIAYHENNWVYIPSHKGSGYASYVGNESGFKMEEQLFNLENDPHQDSNLSAQYPEMLAKMRENLIAEQAKEN